MRLHICRCVVWIEKEITPKEINLIQNVKDLEIVQKTPIRVMHRYQVNENQELT